MFNATRLKLLLSDQVLIQMGLPTLGLALGPKEAFQILFAVFPFSSLAAGFSRALNGLVPLFAKGIEAG